MSDFNYYKIEKCVRKLIKLIGDDPERSGLKETPERVSSSYNELFSGYDLDINSIFKTFDDEVPVLNGMVIARNISFYSTCEHHMLPFSGIAHFGYIPSGNKLIGASKISRLINAYSRRLQIQEKLGQQIINSFVDHIQPQGCMLVLIAKHHCMMCRGIKQNNSDFVTSHISGSFENFEIRNEFLHLISL